MAARHCPFPLLGSLNSRHRKAIKRERRDALASGITIHALNGTTSPERRGCLFDFYIDYRLAEMGRPYLNRRSFRLSARPWRKDVLLVIPPGARVFWSRRRHQFPSFRYIIRPQLGAIEHHPFLHFEFCYYQIHRLCIQRGLKISEAGAQGEHRSRAYISLKKKNDLPAHYIRPRPRSAPRIDGISQA